ncbi:hypothetical protein AGMMS49982_12170 [Bacteroidia bacterium]|nr:hypothetical protein AGMMS49982_12170 [Bacteroidia bacterium]
MTATPYYKVKFSCGGNKKLLLRQTKDSAGFSSDGRYRFFIDEEIDEEIDEADFWVVLSKGNRRVETCCVAPKNTILLTTEPYSVLAYPQSYTRQFGWVHSSQEQIKHPNLIFGQAVLPWYFGFKSDKQGGYIVSQDYNSLIQAPAPQKTKLLSVITSNKAFTQGHIDRLRFVEKLKRHYGDRIDVFGRGFQDFEDKWEILAPYKYHIVIENSSQRYYWTEKIADCFMTETFPFYYGCTNLGDYFPVNAFQPIDILNFDRSVEVVDKIIADDTYEKRKAVLSECKQLVLGKYNIFDYSASLCDTLDAALPKKQVTLQPCHAMQSWHNFYNDLIGRSIFKLKNAL